MKKLLIILGIVLVSLSLFSQKTSSLPGKWKVVSVSTSEGYLNLKTDSFSTPDGRRGYYRDTSERIPEILVLKAIFGKFHYEFGEDGTYREFMADKFQLDTGTYVLNRAKGVLELTRNNYYGQKITDTVHYTLHLGALRLHRRSKDDEWDFQLEKIR